MATFPVTSDFPQHGFTVSPDQIDSLHTSVTSLTQTGQCTHYSPQTAIKDISCKLTTNGIHCLMQRQCMCVCSAQHLTELTRNFSSFRQFPPVAFLFPLVSVHFWSSFKNPGTRANVLLKLKTSADVSLPQFVQQISIFPWTFYAIAPWKFTLHSV